LASAHRRAARACLLLASTYVSGRDPQRAAVRPRTGGTAGSDCPRQPSVRSAGHRARRNDVADRARRGRHISCGAAAVAAAARKARNDAHAVAAFSGIIALNYGWSSFTTARDLDPQGLSHDVGATLAALPAAEFPLTVEVAGEMGACGSDHHYDFVLHQLIGGLRTVDAGS
jgi:hypothetical protein